MSFTLERFVPLIFGFALLLLALIGGATYRSLNSTQQSLAWETHTREVQLHLEKMQSALFQTETSARGFVLIGSEDFLQNFYDGAALFRTQLEALRKLTTDNQSQEKRLKTLQSLGEQKITVLQKFIDLRRTTSAESTIEAIQSGEDKKTTDQIRSLVSELQQEELQLLDMRRGELQTRVNRTIAIILGTDTLGIALLALANFVIVRQLRQRRQTERALAEAHALLEKRVDEQSENLSKTSDELRLENIRRAIAEKKEREQREWWRITLNSIGDCVITTDIEGKINFINRMAEAVTEWSLEEATGVPLEEVFKIVNEHTLQPVESPIAKVLREGATLGLVNSTLLITKSGRYLPIDDSSAPIRDDDGNIIGAALIFRDFTQQRQAELKLRESEHFNRSIFENSPDCVKILELDGTLHSMNSNGLCLMEIDDFSAYAGQQWITFWPEEYQEQARNALQKAVQEGTANFQGFCRTAKGSPKWWDVSVAPILNAEGKPIRLVLTSRDITSRKEQENALRINEIRFRTLTETIPQLVWTCHPNGSISYLSNRWLEYTGTTFEQNLDKGWLQAVHPEDAARAKETWEQAVATSDTYQTEFRLRRADGVYRWHLSRAVRVSDEVGNTVKWFGTSTDIEDHKQAEVERQEMLEREQVLRSRAEEANRLKDEFVATISHELRTPLNAILGWARMMRAGRLDGATTRKAIDVIERSAENQARLIDDLLDMSRIITGKLRLELKTIAPATFVRAALETVMPTANAKEITIQADLDAASTIIAGDANRLQQVVWNLLSNAIKFTPKGGHISVQLQREDAQVVLVVSDNGQGIEPEFLPYVFDRFRQADATSIRKHGGLGLGLSIVRHLVELHGGAITVESKGPHQGATFTIRLPILPPQSSEEKQEAEPATIVKATEELSGLKTEPMLSGLFILAVDDEPDARQLLAQILTAHGATVTTTDSADSALEMIKQRQPDLLVSDIGLPDNDGYSLIRRVRELAEDARKTPAIALTAYARPRDRMQALAAGFNHHVPKPVEPTELVTVIASLTGRLNLSDV